MAGIQITPPASPTNHKPHKTLPSKTDNPLVVMGTGISGAEIKDLVLGLVSAPRPDEQ